MIKLLIADDEMISCTSIEAIVSHYFPQIGMISQAYNGRAAVDKALQLRPDIAIMDIEMPLVNGIEASRRIKEAVPGCAVIFLTAFAEFNYARQAVSLGAAEFLLKPVDEDELVNVLRSVLRQINHKADTAPRPEGKAEAPAEMAPRPEAALADRGLLVVTEAKRYIDGHYMDDISVEGLADRFQISANHFNRMFRQTFDIPCKEYIINVRVDHAKEYLTSPALTVREVGGMVGYPDSNYFAKVFRKKTGMTPTEYRNQVFFLPDV